MSGENSYLTGYRAIEEVLGSHQPGMKLLVAERSPRVAKLVSLARDNGVPLQTVTRAELRRIAGDRARDCVLQAPPGSMRSLTTLADIVRDDDEPAPLIVVLDHVTDPHNFGAILRSADQFGADGVIIPERRSVDLTPVVMQSSAGTAAHVPLVRVPNLPAALEQLKRAGYWVYAAHMDGQAAPGIDLRGRVALVLGAEGRGLSRLVAERADVMIRIPGRGHADSFNVSVAAGILLYEIRRQQNWFASV